MLNESCTHQASKRGVINEGKLSKSLNAQPADGGRAADAIKDGSNKTVPLVVRSVCQFVMRKADRRMDRSMIDGCCVVFGCCIDGGTRWNAIGHMSIQRQSGGIARGETRLDIISLCSLDHLLCSPSSAQWLPDHARRRSRVARVRKARDRRNTNWLHDIFSPISHFSSRFSLDRLCSVRWRVDHVSDALRNEIQFSPATRFLLKRLQPTGIQSTERGETTVRFPAH